MGAMQDRGLRGDALLRANTPNMKGAFFEWPRYPAVIVGASSFAKASAGPYISIGLPIFANKFTPTEVRGLPGFCE